MRVRGEDLPDSETPPENLADKAAARAGSAESLPRPRLRRPGAAHVYPVRRRGALRSESRAAGPLADGLLLYSTLLYSPLLSSPLLWGILPAMPAPRGRPEATRFTTVTCHASKSCMFRFAKTDGSVKALTNFERGDEIKS